MHYLGIDWATEKHDLCLLAEDGRILSEFEIRHDWQGFQKLQALLAEFDAVQINIERSDGLLVDWLVSQNWPVFVTSPNVVSRRRPRRSKDDRGDAYLLAYLLRIGDPECRPLVCQSPTVLHLRQLDAALADVLSEQRRLANRLIQTLHQYYPAVLVAFRKYHSLIVQAFLEAYPCPQVAQALSMDELEAFLRQHRYPQVVKRLPVIYAALQAPAPTARVESGCIVQVQMLAPLLRQLHHQRSHLEKEMVRVFKTHPEAAWWRHFPGANGPLTPVRLLAWIGDDRSRFPSPDVLQAIAGTAPITRRSGKSISVEFRQACSHPLRRVVTDLARQSVGYSGWARSYFNSQRQRGHSKSRAYRALGNRWLSIIWKLWQTGETYDEMKHLANRSRRGQPAQP